MLAARGVEVRELEAEGARDDPYNLKRFVDAQEKHYAQALSELRAGNKYTHWMWFVLPQLRGLGSSARSVFYGIGSVAEAEAYLAHPVLGPRLEECVAAMSSLDGLTAVDVLGRIDAAKFQSCLTLFCSITPESGGFTEALDKYFDGVYDAKTVGLLGTLRHA